jgi:hypothetical protein
LLLDKEFSVALRQLADLPPPDDDAARAVARLAAVPI